MNKERIDEIALRVASEVNLFGRIAPDNAIKAFTHALLAELAKVSEPEAYMYHIKGNGKLTELAAIEYQEQFGETIIHKRALYSIPLPQPDLVDENERKEWALLMNADIERLREQLATAQADNDQLVDALERCKFDSLNMTFDDLKFIREAIAAHKARKEKV